MRRGAVALGVDLESAHVESSPDQSSCARSKWSVWSSHVLAA